MPSGRIGLALVASLFAIALLAAPGCAAEGPTTRIVYRASPGPEQRVTPDLLEQTAKTVARRLQAAGYEGASVRPVEQDRIAVMLPTAEAEAIARAKQLITRPGTLEFALLANRRDHAKLIERAGEIARDVRRPDGTLEAGWREVSRNPDGTQKDVDERHQVVARTVKRDGKPIREFLVVFGPPHLRVTGDDLASAQVATDESGRPALDFQFNQRGGYRFSALTGANKPSPDGEVFRRLAVLLDGRIHQAPDIRTTIGRHVQITGMDDREATEVLAAVLSAGELPLPLDPTPISETTVEPESQPRETSPD